MSTGAVAKESPPATGWGAPVTAGGSRTMPSQSSASGSAAPSAGGSSATCRLNGDCPRPRLLRERETLIRTSSEPTQSSLLCGAPTATSAPRSSEETMFLKPLSVPQPSPSGVLVSSCTVSHSSGSPPRLDMPTRTVEPGIVRV